MKLALKFALLMVLLSQVALAQFTVGTSSGSPSGTAVVNLSYTAQSNIRALQVAISYNPAVLTPQTTTDAIFGELVNGCLASPGANWDNGFTQCVNTDQENGVITVTLSTGVNPNGPALDTAAPFGGITFDIADGASLGIYDLETNITQAFASGSSVNDVNLLTANNGSVTLAITGSAGYASTPDVGETIDLGQALVGQTVNAAAADITVSEIGDQTLNVSSGTPQITGGNAADFASLTADFSILDDGAAVDVDLTCTPSARGTRTSQINLSNNSSNQPVAVYPLTCAGLAPNVTVPGDISINGIVGAMAPTGTFTVTNPQDGFTSEATAVTAAAGVGDAEITVTTAGPTDIAANASFDFVVSCSTAAEGTFTRTIDFSWDGGGTGSADVTCTINDTAPLYNSAPVPATTISVTAPFGTESAADGIDVNNANTNPNGDDLVISSATADNNVFTVELVNTTFAPNVAADGADDVTVTCTPTGVGTVNGTLTVVTNDPNQANYTYPLECVGTGDVLTISPADGAVNLGTVGPGTQAGPAVITLTNNSLTEALSISCTETDASNAFTFTPVPSATSIAVGASLEIQVTAVPPAVEPYSATLACTETDSQVPAFTLSAAVAGRPLVIPTLSHFGTLLLMLSLLLAGGYAVRRMTV